MLPPAAARQIRVVLHIAILGLLTTSIANANALAPAWLPAAIDVDSAPVELYYQGQSGRIAGVEPEALAAWTDAGAIPLVLGSEETLYVVWLEDAARAQFDPPARVLHRNQREVVVAISDGPPRLTEEADRSLAGITQPVRVQLSPIPGPATRAPSIPARSDRAANPAINQMLVELTDTNFMSTWQALEDFVTRYTLAPENELATQWILDQFVSFGLDAEFHTYYQSGQRRNVIATLPGVGDPTKIVYVTSHLDAVTSNPYSCAPGADDNGSGTAAVIEVARVLSEREFEYTVKFACFNGEEQGLIGSGEYVDDIAAAGEDVVAVFNMDMIAYRGTDPAPPDLIIYTDFQSQSVAMALSNAIDTYLPGAIDPVVVNQAMGASDHASFWNYGYPAVLVIEEEAWGGDFCPWYHSCQDVIAQYPTDYVVDCARAVLAATAEVSGAVDVVTAPDAASPTAARLLAARPAPARSGTVFSFELPAADSAELILYGVSGRRVRTVARGRFDAGSHSFVWDGRDDRGLDVAPGVYFYRLTTRDASHAKRLVVVN
jgi:hypothetical protein